MIELREIVRWPDDRRAPGRPGAPRAHSPVPRADARSSLIFLGRVSGGSASRPRWQPFMSSTPTALTAPRSRDRATDPADPSKPLSAPCSGNTNISELGAGARAMGCEWRGRPDPPGARQSPGRSRALPSPARTVQHVGRATRTARPSQAASRHDRNSEVQLGRQSARPSQTARRHDRNSEVQLGRRAASRRGPARPPVGAIGAASPAGLPGCESARSEQRVQPDCRAASRRDRSSESSRSHRGPSVVRPETARHGGGGRR